MTEPPAVARGRRNWAPVILFTVIGISLVGLFVILYVTRGGADYAAVGYFAELLDRLGARITGPMRFRVFLQPAMAIALGVVAGWNDAKTGQPPYLWTLFNEPTQRMSLLKNGWKSVGRLFVLAVVLDVMYQLTVLGSVNPLGAVVTAGLFAIIPFVVFRGLTNRIGRRLVR
jgi:cytochrome b